MITIETPNDLPHGVDLRMYSVANEAEALRIADNGKAYLFQSHTIKALYLFVPPQPGRAEASYDECVYQYLQHGNSICKRDQRRWSRKFQ